MSKISKDTVTRLKELITKIKIDSNDKESKSEFYLIVSNFYKKNFYKTFASKEDFEDAITDVTLRLLEKINVFDEEKSPFPFIKTAFKNNAIDVFRKIKTRRKRETYNTIKENSFYMDDFKLELGDIKEILDKDEYVLFDMKYIQGLPEDEIRSNLKLSKKRYSNLYKTLSRKIIEYNYV